MKMKGLIFGFLTFLFLMMESTILHRIELSGIMPNLTFCMVFSCSLLLGSTFGRRLGLFAGILMDVLFLNVLGFYTLLYYLLGQAVGSFRSGFDSDHLFLTILLGAAFDFVYALICYLFTRFFLGQIDFAFFVVHMVLAEVVYTVPFLVLVFLMIRAINLGIDRLARKTISNNEAIVPIHTGK